MLIKQGCYENPLFTHKEHVLAKEAALSHGASPLTLIVSGSSSPLRNHGSDSPSLADRISIIGSDPRGTGSPPMLLGEEGISWRGFLCLDVAELEAEPEYRYELGKVIGHEFTPDWDIGELTADISYGKLNFIPGHLSTQVLEDLDGVKKAIVKLQQLEPGAPCYKGDLEISCSKLGILPTEGAVSEVLAYRYAQNLHLNQIRIPSTLFAHLMSEDPASGFAAIQRYIPNCKELGSILATPERLSKEALEQIALLDLILLNADRNRGNILIGEDDQVYLIDHSAILPRNFESHGVFSWLDLPQSYEPFSDSNIELINTISLEVMLKTLSDLEPIKELQIDQFEERLNTHYFCLELIKKGSALNLSPAEIAHFFMLTEPDSFFQYSMARKIFLKVTKEDPSLKGPKLVEKMVERANSCLDELVRIKTATIALDTEKKLSPKELCEQVFIQLNKSAVLL